MSTELCEKYLGQILVDEEDYYHYIVKDNFGYYVVSCKNGCHKRDRVNDTLLSKYNLLLHCDRTVKIQLELKVVKGGVYSTKYGIYIIAGSQTGSQLYSLLHYNGSLQSGYCDLSEDSMRKVLKNKKAILVAESFTERYK